MAKTTKAPEKLASLTDAALAHIGNAAYGIARNDVAATEARQAAILELKAAGIAKQSLQPAIRQAYVDRYAATRFNLSAPVITPDMVAAARVILAKPGPNAQSNDRQTADEARVAAAARQSWGRMLKYCGTESTAARAKRTPRGETAQAAKAKAGKAGADKAQPPRPKTPGDVVRYAAGAAVELSRWMNAQQQRKLAIPSHVITLVHDFNKAMRAELKAWEEAAKPAK